MLMVWGITGRSLVTILPVMTPWVLPPGEPATDRNSNPMKNTAHRPVSSGSVRPKARRSRMAAWRRRVREMTACMLLAATAGGQPLLCHGQTGQMGMAPVGGVVNRAAAGFANLNNSGPGWMYYGLNAADRGLGYQGSYMTLGGYIPYAEDDLGGFWSADLRGHLSVYGGFFSNVGVVRKQFLGGTVGGIGVYWDFDGDQNQYANTFINDRSGSYLFPGGATYNQVGVSGEWLTDYGNLRSNGYIPVGSTASTMGPYVGNSLLSVLGVNAALAGADLEVGAWVPGLTEWAGMISVGGYSFGNARYNLPSGKDVVPYFGGVYTRLDMTFLNNWDLSLQANNDSYFDWTGFARLTYRMGGSRRRTVADQIEQPMMRNEHIVRAHQQPQQALNPYTKAPWEVIHVDSATGSGAPTALASLNAARMSASGVGSAENPLATLKQAELVATNPFDIILLHVGNSLNQPYAGGFTFQAENQYLVGEGSGMYLPTANSGLVPVWGGDVRPTYPVIAGGTGTGITLGNGSVVDHLQITGTRIGISDAAITTPGSFLIINDVQIVGSGPNQTGVEILDPHAASATMNFSNMYLQGLSADGFSINTGSGGDPNVNIDNSTFVDTSGSAVVVQDLYNDGRLRLTNSTIDGTSGAGVSIINAQAYIGTTTFRNVGTVGVDATAGTAPGIAGTQATVQVFDSTFVAVPVGVRAQATESGTMNVTINGNQIATTGGNGIIISVADAPNAVVNANVVGNRATGASTVVSGTTTYPNGNILLDSVGWSDDGTIAGQGIINIKAASETNLQGLNFNATVQDVPARLVVKDVIIIPPPPFYNPALYVPLPPN